jgi:hypothetical protein
MNAPVEIQIEGGVEEEEEETGEEGNGNGTGGQLDAFWADSAPPLQATLGTLADENVGMSAIFTLVSELQVFIWRFLNREKSGIKSEEFSNSLHILMT